MYIHFFSTSENDTEKLPYMPVVVKESLENSFTEALLSWASLYAEDWSISRSHSSIN